VARKGRRKQSKSRGSGRGRLRSWRFLLFGVAALVAFLYYSPLQRFVETRGDLVERRTEVAALSKERAKLQSRLQRSTSLEVLRREARRIGYVAPGEQLFIVKGINEWLRAQRETPAVTGRTLPDR
jgi:cell division protein FtsB